MRRALKKNIYVILSLLLVISGLTVVNAQAQEENNINDLEAAKEVEKSPEEDQELLTDTDDSKEGESKISDASDLFSKGKAQSEKVREIKENSTILVNDGEDFQKAIDKIVNDYEGVGTVIVENDIIIDVDQSVKIVGKNDITILANNVDTKITFQPYDRMNEELFMIQSTQDGVPKVTFKNITLETNNQNADLAHVVAIYIQGNADIELDNVKINWFNKGIVWNKKTVKDTHEIKVENSKFENNIESLVLGDNTVAKISKTQFCGNGNNVATGIEADEFKDHLGTSSAKNSEIHIESCEFYKLSSSFGPAVSINACEDTQLYIKNSYFHDNHATDAGGSLYLVSKGNSYVEIDNCQFKNNTISGENASTQVFRGGAICASVHTIEINKTLFENNETILQDFWGASASANGGAIYFDLREKDATIQLNNCNFKSNVASILKENLNNTSVGGGAITLRSADELDDAGKFKMDINNTVFDANEATVENRDGEPRMVCGGALYLFSIDKDVFKEGEFNFSDCTFENNYSYQHGGALFLGNINNINFKNKNIIKGNESLSNGGGIHFTGTSDVMTSNDLVITGNKARYGGGLYITELSLLDGKKLDLNNNEAEYGGAIFLNKASGKQQNFSANQMSIKENKVTGDGGGIWMPWGVNDRADIQFNETVYFADNVANDPYSFDMSNISELNVYNQNVKNAVQSLSTPFSVDSTVENLRFAYNNYDINYRGGWEVTPQNLKVVYDANGATSGTVPMDTKEYYPGQQVSTLDNTGNLEKTGHSFLGWSVNPDAMIPDQSFLIGQEDLTLFAVWETREYKVTLLDDDGTIIDDETVLYGESLEIIGTQTKPTDGKYTYTFDKWIPQGDYTLDNLSFVEQDMVFVASYIATEVEETIIPDEEDKDEGDVLGEVIENDKEQDKVNLQNSTVQTDDETNVSIYIAMLFVVSLALITCVFYKKQGER